MNMKEGPGLFCWVTEKTSNDDLYMFQIHCRTHEFGHAIAVTDDLTFEKWGVLMLNDAMIAEGRKEQKCLTAKK